MVRHKVVGELFVLLLLSASLITFSPLVGSQHLSKAKDFTGDSKIDFRDIGLVVRAVEPVYSLLSADSKFDLDGDGKVTLNDVAIEAGAFGELLPNDSGGSGIKFVQGPTNPQIIASDNASYSLMVNGTYQAYFKNNSKTSKSVRFQNKGYTFDMDISTSQLHWYNSTYNAIIGMVQEMNPQDTQANASRNTLTYSNAWINTDLIYQAYSDQLKETLVIKNVSAPSSSIKPDYLQYVANCYFNNSLTLYANGMGYLHPTDQKFVTNQTIDFNDSSNQTVFWLPTPYLYDSNGTSVTGTYAVTANNGILIINIRVPKTFLDIAVFPVYLDPPLHVHGNDRGTGTATPLAVTLANTPTSGNVLVAVIGTQGSAYRTVSSITETNVAWTYQISQTRSIVMYDVEIWFGVVSASASTSVSIAFSGTPTGAVADICEYSGVATSSFLDKTATANGLGTALSTGTTATTTQASELWIGGTFVGTSRTQATPTNSFTLYDGASTNAVSVAFLEYIASSTGTANSGTTASGMSDWCGCIATFKASVDATAPTATVPASPVNTTVAGAVANFSCQWSDETALSKATLETNNTGALANQTWISLSGTGPSWANFTVTLNSTAGRKVQYKWYCNDTSNNMAQTNTSGVYMTITLTSSDSSAPTYSLPATSYNETKAEYVANLSCYWNDNINVTTVYFCTNNSGAWVNTTMTPGTNLIWNSSTGAWANFTITLNTTIGVVVQYLWNASDAIPNWNTTMTAQSVTTVFYASLTVVTATHSWSAQPGDIHKLITEGVINVTVTSNADFQIQVKSESANLVNGTNTIAVSNIEASKDAIVYGLGFWVNLNTTYQTIPGSQYGYSHGTNVVFTFLMWLSVPAGTRAGTYTYTLDIQVIQA